MMVLGLPLVSLLLLLVQATVTAAAPPAVPPSSLLRARQGAVSPSPPLPETIELVRLPLPPAISDHSPGACDEKANPLGTGCMPVTNGRGFMSGGFLPDGRHVLALIPFVGAPPPPAPGSAYNGSHIVVVKTDETVFSNGDKWKCLTCGVPGVPNTMPANATEHLDYPQAFSDGKRALVGTYILDCGDYDLASEACTMETIRLLPLRWNTAANGSGPGGAMRELRLHPDNVHLGFSSFTTSGGKLGQLAYFGRLEYNPSPATGTPLTPRYDVVNVSILVDETSAGPVQTACGKVTIHPGAISVGELRAFSAAGDEVIYVGYPAESSNLDMYAVNLDTGKVRRLTSNPEYVDPIEASPDGKWWAIMDTRGTNRQMFLAGMRGIPPLTDLVSSSVTSSTRNNGQRRFFNPWLLDAAGDRSDYYGQKINGPGGELGAGGLDDPQWNGQADPRWSPDSTRLVYWEAQTVAPACGSANPLPCFPSLEDGGRDVRMIMATFTDRAPSPRLHVSPRPDAISWAVPYVPGTVLPDRPSPDAGVFILQAVSSGHPGASGTADVVIEKVSSSSSSGIRSVSVTYHDYTEDGVYFLNGHENVTSRDSGVLTLGQIDWLSNLTQTGPGVVNTKLTGEGGFSISVDVLVNIFKAEGTMTTTVDGKTYRQPLNGA